MSILIILFWLVLTAIWAFRIEDKKLQLNHPALILLGGNCIRGGGPLHHNTGFNTDNDSRIYYRFRCSEWVCLVIHPQCGRDENYRGGRP
ncbi:hypothetical protein [Methanogenium cariaci]|uniref:hypothetical protein n=1 Tax=Methanogenium cariaci TaxID=2197 RepID=UPI0012F6D906|nr:hypothetical protein [Methanogenium cariaci]